MTSTLSLQAGSFGQVLGVLSREHESWRTTAWHRLTYRLLLGDVAVLLLSGVLFVILEIVDHTHSSSWWGMSGLIVVLAFVLLIPLFLLNLPTLVRLWRYARMIRRLRLPAEVQRLIRLHGRRQVLTAIVAYPAALLGLGLVALGTYGVIFEGHAVVDFLFALAFLFAGGALASVAYLRRGHRRLRAVSEFLRLERARIQVRFDVDVEDWATVVALERRQVFWIHLRPSNVFDDPASRGITEFQSLQPNPKLTLSEMQGAEKERALVMINQRLLEALRTRH